MKALKLAVAAGLVSAALGVVAPAAHANDCSNPKTQCGGCSLNPNFSLDDPMPVRCYPT